MHGSFFFNNALDVIIAVVIDWLIGDPYWFPHPVTYIGKLIGFLDKRARKISKSNEQMRFLGGIIVVLVSAVGFLIPYGILKFAAMNFYAHHAVNIIIIWTTLAARCLDKEASKVYQALKRADLEDARVKISYIVGRDTSSLSDKEIVRADVETVAENASDGIIAPLLYAFIGGAPLAMMYKAVNTMDSMLGYMNEKFRYIGFFPAKVDDVVNLIPARLTGVLMCMCAPAVGGSPVESFKIMMRDRKNHKSPNCAYPEGATAGALRIQLGGTNVYFGEVVYKPTIGDKKVELDLTHIAKSIRLMYASEILMTVAFAVITFFNIGI